MLHLMKVIQPMQKYAIFPILLCDTHCDINWYSVVITRTTFYREFLGTILKNIYHRVQAVKRGSRDFNASAKSGTRLGSRSRLMGYIIARKTTMDKTCFGYWNGGFYLTNVPIHFEIHVLRLLSDEYSAQPTVCIGVSTLEIFNFLSIDLHATINISSSL